MSKITAKIKHSITDEKLKSDIEALEKFIAAKTEKLNQKAAALAAKAARESAAETAAKRKLDARKKILLGASLVALAKDDATLKVALEHLMKKLDATETNESNRKALGLSPLKKDEPTKPATAPANTSAAATSVAKPEVTQPTAATVQPTTTPEPQKPSGLGSMFRS